MTSRPRLATVALAALLGGAACRHAPPPPPPPPVAPIDTARGVVRVVGAEPGTSVILRRDDLVLPLDGGVADALRPLVGVEVMVMGRVAGETLRPERFAVRAVDGVPALDGRLVAAPDGGVRLRLADGSERPLPQAPAALRAMAGARVYWVGPTDRAPQGYGVITPR